MEKWETVDDIRNTGEPDPTSTRVEKYCSLIHFEGVQGLFPYHDGRAVNGSVLPERLFCAVDRIL